MSFIVGEGNRVPFLVGDWVGVSRLSSVVPRLFQLAFNKLSSAIKTIMWVREALFLG